MFEKIKQNQAELHLQEAAALRKITEDRRRLVEAYHAALASVSPAQQELVRSELRAYGLLV